jgi:hypothetical protein
MVTTSATVLPPILTHIGDDGENGNGHGGGGERMSR